MNTNFYELSYEELGGIDGGINWDAVGVTVSGAAGAALGYAAAGAIVGSAAPGVGTTIGGIVGGAVGVIAYTFFD